MKNFQLIEFPPSSEPTPLNYDEEVKAVNEILDEVESLPSIETNITLGKYITVTPWVAWQLGIYAEHISTQGEHLLALKIAIVSIEAAWQARAWDRLYANFLSYGNVWLRAKHPDDAVAAYLHLLELPYEGGANERIAAHLNLANIYDSQGQTEQAIYHYERVLSRVKPFISEENYLNIISNVARLYTQIEDIAGMTHSIKLLKLADAEALLRDSIKDGLSINSALNLTTRLHLLNESDLAEVVSNSWKERRTSSD